MCAERSEPRSAAVVWPASTSRHTSNEATCGAASPDIVVRQVVQCVGDLRWQTTSWCESGKSAAPTMYIVTSAFTSKREALPKDSFRAVRVLRGRHLDSL
jgi:hypothetical protein